MIFNKRLSPVTSCAAICLSCVGVMAGIGGIVASLEGDKKPDTDPSLEQPIATLPPQEKQRLAKAKRAQAAKMQAERLYAQASQKRIEKKRTERANKELKGLTAYVSLFNKGYGRLVESVSIQEDEATIMVSDAWHFLPQQLRLQRAQELWAVWAKIHSKTKPDHSFLKLVDGNGNRVGGSGFVGSSVSVND